MPRPLRSIALLAAPLLAVLAGCTSPDSFPPPCPQIGMLRDGADMTRFAANGHDVTDVVLQARLAAFSGSCKQDGPDKVRTTFTVQADLGRGPAATGRGASVGYFVAVADGGKVIDEHDYAFAGSFPPNVERVRVTSDPIDIVVPVSQQKTADAYHVYISFRLTPDQLAYNRGQH
jgi:hypothetical protein